MGPAVDPVISNAALPATTRVVVIGGGIIGCAAALDLAERGIPVVLCEKGHIGCEQSSRNWGWCRQAGRDEREMPLIVESLRLWRDMDRLTGTATGFRACGVLYVAESAADEQRFDAWLDMARPFEIGARRVRGGELGALMPGAGVAYRSGLYVPGDGCAEPQLAAAAIARAAQRRGALIFGQCAARGLERTAGRVSAVITERGRLACDAVILAGGAWSSLFCASLGVRLPQLKVLASVQRTAPVEGPEPCTYLRNLGYRKRLDGGYTLASTQHTVPLVPDSLRFLSDFLPMIRREPVVATLRLNGQSWRELRSARQWPLDRPSPFETTRVLDPPPNTALNAAARAAMTRLFPQFRDVATLQQWGGYIDVTPDMIPYIGAVDSVPGLTIATGFSGHGFGIAPAAGQLAAEIAVGQTPKIDPSAFRVARFSDGSPIVMGPDM